MRLRLFHKKVKKGNQLDPIRYSNIGTADIGTANVTYETVTRASTATHLVNTRFDIPTTAWSGTAPGTPSMYVTGLYLYIGARGVWGSALIGTG